MARGQLDALGRHQIQIGIMGGRGGLMHGLHHALVGLRAGDGQHAGIGLADGAGLGAHAAGDDHLAILVERRADGGEGFRLGGIEEAAGVDHHGVGPRMAAGQLIALGAQAGDDPFGINQRLGAAKGDEGNLGGGALIYVGHGLRLPRGRAGCNQSSHHQRDSGSGRGLRRGDGSRAWGYGRAKPPLIGDHLREDISA